MILNIFTILVMILLAAVIGIAVATLGMLPRKIARDRGHPQADAINVASWIGVITGGLLWPLALIWAYTRPAGSTDEVARLGSRLGAVEQRLARLQADKEVSR